MDRGSVFFLFVFILPSFTFGISPPVYLLNVWNKSHENGEPICIIFCSSISFFSSFFPFFLFGNFGVGICCCLGFRS